MKTKKPIGNPNWKKGGASPNPGGRPKGLTEFRELLRDRLTMKAIEALERNLRGADAVRAAVEALSFGWGRAAQQVQVTGASGGPVQVERVPVKGLSDEALALVERALEAVAKASHDEVPGLVETAEPPGSEG